VNRAAAAAAIDAFLEALGRNDPDIAGTGARVADMFADELCAGYAVDTKKLLEDAIITNPTATLVAVRDIPVVTTCPHHLLPSIGRATVAFKSSRLLGLGTIAQLVDAHARRLALQERIGEDIVDDLASVLAPEWVGCRLVLAHGCMIARGERAFETRAETIALRGPVAITAEAHAILRSP
jgi:GTP cyclohydrolase I